MRDIGLHGLALVKGFEGFYPYVYDDMAGLRRNPTTGKLAPPEWNGGPARGTLTIGYGHTNMARHPLKIHHGLRISEAEGVEILRVDMGECVEAVNKLVKVPLTQGQFDALASFAFNCGVGSLRSLILPLNRGKYDATRANFSHYVRSKGVVLAGLERRRHAEQVLWDDRYEVLHAEHIPTEPVPHPAVVDPREESRDPPAGVDTAGVVLTGAAATEAVAKANEALSTVQMAQDSLSSVATTVLSSPGFWLAIVAIGVGVYLWLTHHRK